MKEAHRRIVQLLAILSLLIGPIGALTYVRKQFIEQSPPIRTIVDISHRQCLKECQLRTDCKTISYKRRASYCRLHADIDPLSGYNRDSPKSYWNEPILGDYYEDSSLHNQIDLGNCQYTICLPGYTCVNHGRPPCKIKECNKPLTGNHTKVYGNMVEIGAKIKKTCVSPYLPSTFKRYVLSQCQTNGEWNNLDVLCSCGTPIQVEHAYVENEVTSLNATVTYKCNYGYIKNGTSSNSTCLINGTWTEPEMSCSPVDCGVFNTINNSRVVSSGGTTFGHTVEYICENDTVPNNASRIATCSGTGLWTPVINLTCTYTDCGQPKAINNTVMTIHHGVDIVTYTCKPGYENVAGDAVLVSSKCEATGHWSDVQMVCRLPDFPDFKIYQTDAYASQQQIVIDIYGSAVSVVLTIDECADKCRKETRFCIAFSYIAWDMKCILADQLDLVYPSPESNIWIKNVGIVFYPREYVLYGVTDAQKYCESHGTEIANLDDVEHAYSLGYNMETCGWIEEDYGVVILHYETTSYNKTGIIKCQYTPTLILYGGVFCKEILPENSTVVN